MAYRWTLDDVLKTQAGRAAITRLPVDAAPREVNARLKAAIHKPRGAKYGNRKVTEATGAVHDSGKEYRRWCDLQLRQRAGEISDLHRQRVFDLVVNGVLVCRYKADATYVEGGALVVEDTKPNDPKFRKTLAYRHFKLKALLMKACHGIDVMEV